MKQTRAPIKAASRRSAIATRALTGTLVCFKRGSYPGAGRGVGPSVLPSSCFDRTGSRHSTKGLEYPDELVASASRAAARGVLAVMPQFDEMIKKAALPQD